MKKTISIILCILLLFGSASLCFADNGVGNIYINVGLYYMSTAVSELKIESDMGFLLADKGKYTYSVTADYSDYTVLNVKAEGSSVNVYSADGVLVIGGLTQDKALISAAADPDDMIISIGGKQYRIGVCFGAYGDGTMAAANYVDLEHYAWGVLPLEMTYTNPDEALKAQAVALRSFALASLGKHGGGALSFDVCSKSHCQVYGGVSAEYDRTTDACKATKGMIIAYNGKPATAYYHSNSFGYTLSAQQLWGSDIPYAQSVYDPYGSDHNWATSFSFSEIESRLKSHGKGVGTLKSVEVGSRYDNGAVASLIFTGSNGNVTISRNNIMSYFNLKSLAFSMSGSPDPAIIRSGSTTVNAVGKNSSNLCSDSVYTVDASGNVVQLALSEAVIYNGSEYGSAHTNNDAAVFTDETVSSGMMYLAGLGYGHCVGMNQSGARGMARAGFGYQDILKFYYTGVSVCDFHEILQ